jgi:LL-diaminopimelate aminotransferase
MFLNNPHNPTGRLLDSTDLTELVRTASRENIFIVNDAAYCSFAEEKYIPLLSIPGGSKVSMELFSFTYCFGLPYIPLGFAVGPPDVINGLNTVSKSAGKFIPKAWIEPILNAISNYPSRQLEDLKKGIEKSRLEAEQLVEKYSWQMVRHKSSPFVWIKIPGRRHASNLAETLLIRKGILALPGNAFGDTGEGYFRLSLTAPPEDFKAAGERLEKRLALIPKKAGAE